MELKTAIPLLVVRQFGNVASLNNRYGGATGVQRVLVEGPTPTDAAVRSGVTSSQSPTERPGGIKFTCGGSADPKR